MKILIDTSILRNENFLTSRKAEMLRDFISKTEHKCIIPEVVYEEITALYKRSLLEKQGKIIRCYEEINKILGTPIKPQEPLVDIENELKSFHNNLKKKLRLVKNSIIPLNCSHLPNLVDRAINRIHPFSDNKAEFRDALIWLSILDIAESQEEKEIIFISANTKEFAEKEDVLHPSLLEEARSRGLTIQYYTSLDAFLKKHASRIEFLDRAWIEENIDIDGLGDEVVSQVEKFSIRRLSEKAKNQDDNFDEISSIIQCVHTWVSDFYVYEMVDGSIRVEAALESEIEVEYSTWKINEDSFDSDHRVSGYRIFYPTVEFDVHIVVKDKKVVSKEIVDIYL